MPDGTLPLPDAEGVLERVGDVILCVLHGGKQVMTEGQICGDRRR